MKAAINTPLCVLLVLLLPSLCLTLNVTETLSIVIDRALTLQSAVQDFYPLEELIATNGRLASTDAGNLARKIREELLEMPRQLISDTLDLQLLIQDLVEEENAEECGSWMLGMNLNPSDGHIMGYEEGWDDDRDIGEDANALSLDYLNQTVWTMPASYIAIARHHRGHLDAVKVFEFKTKSRSLSQRFKDMDPGRRIETAGGALYTYTAPGALNLGDDPIFGVGGDLAFNWGYSDNGNRIVLTGGHLSEEGVNDDNTHGLGNHFAIDPKTGSSSHNSVWSHEISNIQDCPLSSCRTVKMQGTDHGTGPHLISGPVYGNYAIYVAESLTMIPTSAQLDLVVPGICMNLN